MEGDLHSVAGRQLRPIVQPRAREVGISRTTLPNQREREMIATTGVMTELRDSSWGLSGKAEWT